MVDGKTFFRRIYLSALVTPLCLIGGLMLGFVLGSLTFDTLPGHMRETSRILIAATFAVTGMLAGGAAWGWILAKILGSPHRKGAALAGAVGIAVTTIAIAMLLGRLEVLLVEQGRGPQLPIHRTFTLLFVPAAAVIAGVGGAALGMGLGKGTAAFKIGAGCALAGGLAFLVVNLIMEASGWVVGAPGAAERATMLTVMFSGNLAAAIAGGAVIGAAERRQNL
jgi:hypothetical protein